MHFLQGGLPTYRREEITVERCLHAPYYGEWVRRQGEVAFRSVPGWLSHDEADARLRAAYAVVKKVSG